MCNILRSHYSGMCCTNKNFSALYTLIKEWWYQSAVVSEKLDDSVDEFCPNLRIENIAKFITLPAYTGVEYFDLFICMSF